jgi:hypothetical protein
MAFEQNQNTFLATRQNIVWKGKPCNIKELGLETLFVQGSNAVLETVFDSGPPTAS